MVVIWPRLAPRQAKNVLAEVTGNHVRERGRVGMDFIRELVFVECNALDKLMLK